MTINGATLINVAGFITGALLYSLLLVMALSTSRLVYVAGPLPGRSSARPNYLPLLTAFLGLSWNLGAFLAYGLRNFGSDPSHPLIIAVAFTALGFLPAVVVHSTLRRASARSRHGWIGLTMVVLAYALSACAGCMHIYAAVVTRAISSHVAFHALTVGYGLLIVALLFVTRDQPGWERALWFVAISVFAVSAQHLSHHDLSQYPWWVELIGHHASLPLVLAILYQDDRFALADIFLKRALALILLVGIALALYASVAASALTFVDAEGNLNPQAIGLLLVMWVATVLFYPTLRRAVDRFVDTKMLGRVNYTQLRAEIAQLVDVQESPEVMLDEVCRRLATALTARQVQWLVASGVDERTGGENNFQRLLPVIEPIQGARDFLSAAIARATGTDFPGSDFVDHKATKWYRASGALAVLVPTVEPPQYLLGIGELTGGRRILSDELTMLEAVAFLVARRIDVMRVQHERCERTLREQEIGKLATEAELRALRAQINPHFLFNALTTVGYLIQTAPDRALSTLMRLSGLLRSMLRRSAGEFASLGDEIDLVEAYLDIERARFEQRLCVKIDVPHRLRQIPIPTLVLQPLVENAIKHGIGPCRDGGTVVVEARSVPLSRSETVWNKRLCLSVRDTGTGASQKALANGRARGLGLRNVEQRLHCHYGDAATLLINSTPGAGTTVELQIPVNVAEKSAVSAANLGESRNHGR